MSCEIPVIATNNEVNKEILENTGLYVQPNKEDCSEKIVTLIKDKKLRTKLSKLAKERANKYHLWSSRGKICN